MELWSNPAMLLRLKAHLRLAQSSSSSEQLASNETIKKIFVEKFKRTFGITDITKLEENKDKINKFTSRKRLGLISLVKEIWTSEPYDLIIDNKKISLEVEEINGYKTVKITERTDTDTSGIAYAPITVGKPLYDRIFKKPSHSLPEKNTELQAIKDFFISNLKKNPADYFWILRVRNKKSTDGVNAEKLKNHLLIYLFKPNCMSCKGKINQFIKETVDDLEYEDIKSVIKAFKDPASKTGDVLQLDHIDGDSKNNFLNNLRLLCVTCHNFTPTYGNVKNVNITQLKITPNWENTSKVKNEFLKDSELYDFTWDIEKLLHTNKVIPSNVDTIIEAICKKHGKDSESVLDQVKKYYDLKNSDTSAAQVIQ